MGPVSSFAFVLVFAAAITHAAWNVIAHGSSRSGVPFLWAGSLCSTVIWAAAVPVTGGIGTTDVGGFLAGIGVSALIHVGYMLVLQRGYTSGDLSTVYATARGVGPLLSVVVAIAVLGERPSPLSLVGIALIIAGVVGAGLIGRRGRGTTGKRVDPALVFGVLTGVAIAAYTLWDTAAVRTWGISPVAFMVGCTFLETLLFTAILGRCLPSVVPVVREQWRTLVAFGILSPLAYILVLTAVAIAPLALVAPLREVSVVIVSLYGVVVLRESSPALRLGVSVVVVGGIALIAS
ncbi:hypothetical protein CSIV_08115 [Microbacterium sp. CSI-V]|uniref:hypothetical protein n=1 Tax=Microbacterium sp. CSI-V TaxID=1933777 RepID=UPI00097CA2D2|nr:hypothetical protein CSIV_08115 [Microbacterium sp. CSI-V]